MLELRDLASGYGRLQILKGIHLKVETGQIAALIGANGAGKTTTLNTICGLVRATRGQILLDGQDVAGGPTQEIVARGVAQVPEGRKLFSDMTVAENLLMGAYLRRQKREIAGDLERVHEIFPILKERGRQRAGSLSGGEQQMCAIGRALMARPRLLLLDEPSLGLAPILVETIFNIIQTINRQGTTILLVEQNARMALSISQMAYVMTTGEIHLSGPGAELLRDEGVKKAYLGEI